jgi:hypothetical protein
MSGKFWESVGGRLADRFGATGAPALLFWVGGLLAWAHAHDGWRPITDAFGRLERQSAIVQLAVLGGVLTGVLTSALVLTWLTGPALRALEGYLPWPTGAPRRALIRRELGRAARLDWSLQDLLATIDAGQATSEQLARFQRLHRQRRDLPSRPERFMPTRLGNILRASESRPVDKYGLDPVAVWPHLWLVLPDTARAELVAARAGLDRAVAGVLWGTLFIAFSGWSIWALPAGASVAAIAGLSLLPSRARAFGGLFEAAVDVYRSDLYRKLRWPLPTNPRSERDSGHLVTRYLVRGMDATEPVFTTDDK